MTPPAKKPAKSWLLYLLVAVLVAILVCAGLILWLTLLRDVDQDVVQASEPELLLENSTTTTTSTLPTTTTVTTSTVGSTVDTVTMETSTVPVVTSSTMETSTVAEEETSTTVAEEIALPLDVESILKEKTKDFELVQKCSEIEALPVTCQQQSSLTYQNASPSQFLPLHYNLNLTIRDVRNTVVEGVARLFATSRVATQGVAVHAAKLHNLDATRIRVINCDSGETLCISKIQQNEQVLVIETAQTIEPATNVRIDFNGFISSDATPHVYKQVPTGKWRVPAMLGSVFEPTSARHLFPAFDNHDQKSTFSVCVSHPPQMSVISNSAPLDDNQTGGTTCFAKTVPITAQQFALVAHDETAHLYHNKSTHDGAYLPDFEILFNLKANFKPAMYEWIQPEIAKVMVLMSKWSKFSFPLDKLTIVVAPVMTGHSALGVITLPAQAVAYQKHTTTHETLIKEVIGQWMEGVVTTEHTCFEKALIQYLEWKINEELQIVKKTRKLEIAKIRPRNLNETSEQLRVIRSVVEKTACSPRFIEVFYTLDETYGEETVVGIIRVIFEKFAFSTATISDWQTAAETATGKPEAGKLIAEWFSRPTSRPVLHAHVTSQNVEFTQLTDELWSVPLEISGSGGVQVALIEDKKQTIPFVSTDYVVVDPARKSHAFVVYDADTYLRLIRCFGDSTRCPSKQIGAAFTDLAATLIANRLPTPTPTDTPKWKSIFKFMAQQNLVEGTAACCVEHAIQEMRKCSYWDIQDVCTKIEFNSVLTRGTGVRV